ncbi:MAG: 1-acyl-sn-glycerol-3-phosphate acyltransferase [Proteobacteria bacterium]|nr:1-acyl-sn-glycerol-3-phosphate acyltransferase [Pseudomonadota bacterium]MBU1712247.1 1-acyl-sn-glycerol-3-phosphate acyltransferase [Pseudomonadota bacterium]
MSPEKRNFLVEKIPGWPSFVYYTLLIDLLLRDSLMARIGKYDHERWRRSAFEIIKIIESAGGRLNVSGLTHIAEYKGPLVYVSNHMSMTDTFIIPSILLAFNRLTFVVKEELLNYPVFGSIMKAINLIGVSRQNPREDLRKVLSEGEAFIKSGYSVGIFPQATRSAVFNPNFFNSLGVKLARRAGVPVVPVALKTDFQGNGTFIKDMGPVEPDKTIFVEFGVPLQLKDNDSETHRKIVRFIVNNIKKWGGIVEDENIFNF